MREIKFRGMPWEMDIPIGDRFFYGSFVDAGSKKFIWNQRLIEVDPKTVGQYTGLKDKNGKEIYEGDIVRILLNSDEGEVLQIVAPVIFDEENLRFAIYIGRKKN